jgi:hypothetical protein
MGMTETVFFRGTNTKPYEESSNLKASLLYNLPSSLLMTSNLILLFTNLPNTFFNTSLFF